MSNYAIDDTIVAISTGTSKAAIAVIRLSGKLCFEIAEKITTKRWGKIKENTQTYCQIIDIQNNNNQRVIDNVLISTFRAPHSYTKEDVIEISCHASPYIIEKIVTLCIALGARQAMPGEFTQRAYLNGQLDLSQAEAVADLIEAESMASHRIAMRQLKGNISKEVRIIREQLLDFASLLELELDFGEEDVEFADRKQLKEKVVTVIDRIKVLVASFTMGNAFKHGIPVAIAGKPNAGKSTLLNSLLQEDKAIVSSQPGTTRDAIEDILVIEGIKIRLIDTAGLRDTSDEIEQLGIKKTWEKIEQAGIIIHLIDATTLLGNASIEDELQKYSDKQQERLMVAVSKCDMVERERLDIVLAKTVNRGGCLILSAKSGKGISALKAAILTEAGVRDISEERVLVSNIRHKQQLELALTYLESVSKGIDDGITHDWLATDMRHALQHLGEISGAVSNEDILSNIFGSFCIGK